MTVKEKDEAEQDDLGEPGRLIGHDNVLNPLREGDREGIAGTLSERASQ